MSYLKCVICNKTAVCVFNGCSLCEEHLKEEKKKFETILKNSAEMMNNIKEKMGIKPAYEIK